MNAWIAALGRATTEAEVVATARDYCSLFSPRELEVFPEDCRVICIEGSADIPRYRDKLARYIEMVGDRLSDPAKVVELVRCLEVADARLGTLKS